VEGKGDSHGDTLGRAPGTALWPERFNEEALRGIARVLGPSFAALYQGRPKPATGGLFRREWFDVVARAPEGIPWVRFWDTAAKAGQQSDYWAGAKVGRSEDGHWYISGMVRGRWEYPDARRVVLATAALDGPAVTVGIEESASGTALLQDLRRDTAAQGHAFWPLGVRADKAVRAGVWASQAQGGLVHLVAGPWTEAFLEEVLRFPLGRHDDQVDAVSGACELWLEHHRPFCRPVVRVTAPRNPWLPGSSMAEQWDLDHRRFRGDFREPPPFPRPDRRRRDEPD
jgi:predicted phage terminase large subunit-like protein